MSVSQTPSSLVIEFLARLAEDRLAGRAFPLTEYLARFPGHDVELAGAYAETLGELSATASGAEAYGPYRLVRQLGRGGQGVVWLAEDTRIGRRVALKVVARPPSAENLTPRLLREAKAAGRLDHPGLCPVFDVGSNDACAWIAMRYVEGGSLAQLVETGRLEPLEARLLLLETLARALHAAHQEGVVHRDVKPGNIMVTPEGDPVLVDFGTARDDLGVSWTLEGDALGTPAYMAPEQIRGELIDRRVDVWGLGVTAFEYLTGVRPFTAGTREGLLRAILEGPVPDPRRIVPDLPRDLSVVLATALERDTTRRYATALDLAQDLERVRQQRPIRARSAGPLVRLRSWARRNPGLAVSLASIFALLVIGIAVSSVLLARTRAALERRDALVQDVANLSDHVGASELIARESALWPANEARVPDIETWLAEVEQLEARRPGHAAARAGLLTRQDLDPDPQQNALARNWLVERIDALQALLDELSALRPGVQARLESARNLRARSIDLPGEAWARAARETAADPRYAGLELRPQLGLVPLGPDPASGLQEFAHLMTGRLPARDPSTGALEVDGETAIVLVLVPAGSFSMGARRPDHQHPPGSPNADPWTGQWDGPPLAVALEPYFIGKYEVTQGQWTRHDGGNPSAFVGALAEERVASFVSDAGRLPVEGVSWSEAARVTAELALGLPTEAQWEYAARGGTATVFYTGDEIASLQGHANFADSYARGIQEIPNWRYAMELDDGFLDTAPVGSLLPNPYGLHDVHGNVVEWCRDTWEDLEGAVPRAGDGFIEGREPLRVQRGGGFSQNPIDGRCGRRGGTQPEWVSALWGLRVARALEP